MNFTARMDGLLSRVETRPNHSFRLGGTWLGTDGNEEIMVYLDVLTDDQTREGDEGRYGGPKGTGPDETYTVNFNLPFGNGQPDEEIFERLLKMSLMASHHEMQEWFRVDGKLLKDPHLTGLFSMAPVQQQQFPAIDL